VFGSDGKRNRLTDVILWAIRNVEMAEKAKRDKSSLSNDSLLGTSVSPDEMVSVKTQR
jgi:hypothetical protein